MRHGSCSELQLPRRTPGVAELWRYAMGKKPAVIDGSQVSLLEPSDLSEVTATCL